MLHTPTPQEIRPKRQRKKKTKNTHWVISLFLFYVAWPDAYLPVPPSTCEDFNMMCVQEDVLRTSSLWILGDYWQSSDGLMGP